MPTRYQMNVPQHPDDNYSINKAFDRNYGNRLKSGDTTPLKYTIKDGDGEPLDKDRLMGMETTVKMKHEGVTAYEAEFEATLEEISEGYEGDLVARYKIMEALPPSDTPYIVEFHFEEADDRFIFPSGNNLPLYITPSSLNSDGEAIKNASEQRLNEIVERKLEENPVLSEAEAKELARQENYQELLDTGVMQTKINERLEDLEEEYAPKLTELTAQLAQTDFEIRRKIGDGKLATMSDMGQDVKEAMTGGSVAVVGENTIVEDNIVDGAVTKRKTRFLENKKINPFLDEGSMDGYRIKAPVSDSFEVVADPNYTISSDIELLDTSKLFISLYSRIVIYNSSNQPVYAEGDYSGILRNKQLTLPEDSQYTKVSILKDYIDDFYVWQNGVFLVEKPEYKIQNLMLDTEQAKNTIEKIGKKAIDMSAVKQVDVISEKSVNLFNKEKAVDGHYGDGGRFINSQCSTGLIPVKPNTTYIATSVTHDPTRGQPMTFLDSEKNVIRVVRYNNDGSGKPKPFVTTSDTQYVSFYLDTNMVNYRDYPLGWHPDNFVLVEGNTLPDEYVPYQPLEYRMEGLVLDEKLIGLNNNMIKVFERNKDFYSTHFRIPFMCVTNKGTIIAGSDIRYDSWSDYSYIDIGTARSEDGGATWIDKKIAIPNSGETSLSRAMDGTILPTSEGRIYLLGNLFDGGTTPWTRVETPSDPNWDIVLYHSDDDGKSWQFNQSLRDLLPEGDISFLGGVGSGIEMKDGTLVFPIQIAKGNDEPFDTQSSIIYSLDGGASWEMGDSFVPKRTSECSVVEYPTGTLLINCRQENQNHRSVYQSTDLGTTWTETPMNSGTIQTNACQGHMIKAKVGFSNEAVLFSNPINDGTNREDGAYSGYDRSNLSLSVLQNDTNFQPMYTLYRPHSDGYSCLSFDERKNKLYVVMEIEYNLAFKDISYLLPTIQLYKNIESMQTVR